jgi:hypothetical protein
MAVLIMHEVIRAIRITRVIAAPLHRLNHLSDLTSANRVYLIWIKFKVVPHDLSSMTDLAFCETGVEYRSDASDVGLKTRGVKKQCAKRRGSVHFQPPAVR